MRGLFGRKINHTVAPATSLIAALRRTTEHKDTMGTKSRKGFFVTKRTKRGLFRMNPDAMAGLNFFVNFVVYSYVDFGISQPVDNRQGGV
jgi:hypothetical protein